MRTQIFITQEDRGIVYSSSWIWWIVFILWQTFVSNVAGLKQVDPQRVSLLPLPRYAPPPRRQIIADHFRAFRHCCQHNPCTMVHNRAQQRHCESDASDEKIQKTSLLQYDKIRWDWEAFRSASTALSLCRAWKHCCLRDSSAPPKEQAKRRVQEGSQRSKIGNYTQWMD